MPSSIHFVVSGFGTSGVNGVYSNNDPFPTLIWVKDGDPNYQIVQVGGVWFMRNSAGTIAYYNCTSCVAFDPESVCDSTWAVNSGSLPIGTVTCEFDSSSSQSSVSSSSSSFGYSSSSSSSSRVAVTRELRDIAVSQGNHNLLPFTFISERGYTEELDESVLNFTISSASSTLMDVDAVIGRDNSNYTTTLQTTELDVYVPQDERMDAWHDSITHVDIIAKDPSGIREARVHVEPDAYDFDLVEDVFYIPKFTWAEASTTTTTTAIPSPPNDAFWTGAGHTLANIKYDRESASFTYSEDLGSPVNNVAIDADSSRAYVSSNNFLYRYSSDQYAGSNDREVAQITSVANDGRAVISLYHGGFAWAVESYDGNIVKLDATDLSEMGRYSGFDAPYKILWSEFHQSYFVAGSYLLWKIDDASNTVETIYEINGFQLEDVAISEDGRICMVLGGSGQDLIRVIDNDLFTLLLDERITDANLRFCEYCQEGRFYVLGELSSESTTYAARHYVFDSNSKVLESVDTDDALSTTTTTSTLGTTSKAVEVEFPNGDEQLQIGETYEIRWVSSKSATDFVKIELYRKGQFDSLIAESTPNNGVYEWTIPEGTRARVDYKIQITWISASSDPNNIDQSDEDFEIATTVTTTTTSTTTPPAEQSVGVGYDKNNDQVVILLRSGLYGLFELPTSTFYGMVDSGVTEPIFITTQNVLIGQSDTQEKVRVFVGSQEHYSDKWDSGIVETELTSMYYGGGNNLTPGETYYVHIQTYSQDEGWGELQIKEFVMPR